MNFENLDDDQPADEEQQILSDPSFGADEDEREQKLTNAKNYARGYLLAGIGVLISSVIVLQHQSNLIMYLVLMIFPAVGIFLVHYFNGLILFLAGKRSAYGSAEIGLMTAVALIFLVFQRYNFVNIYQLAIPGVVISAAIFITIYVFAFKKIKTDYKTQLIAAVMYAIAYGFGIAATVNCVFDQGEPQVCVSQITYKRMHEGSRSTYYHLYLSKWGPYNLYGPISVSSSLYEQVPVGVHVRVRLMKGVFDVPWYYLEKP